MLLQGFNGKVKWECASAANPEGPGMMEPLGALPFLSHWHCLLPFHLGFQYSVLLPCLLSHSICAAEKNYYRLDSLQTVQDQGTINSVFAEGLYLFQESALLLCILWRGEMQRGTRVRGGQSPSSKPFYRAIIVSQVWSHHNPTTYQNAPPCKLWILGIHSDCSTLMSISKWKQRYFQRVMVLMRQGWK